MSDMFQVITPEQVVVNTSDADVIMDILNRKNDFPKYQPVLGGRLTLLFLFIFILANLDHSPCQALWRELSHGKTIACRRK
jgi:hypothetical protein